MNRKIEYKVFVYKPEKIKTKSKDELVKIFLTKKEKEENASVKEGS